MRAPRHPPPYHLTTAPILLYLDPLRLFSAFLTVPSCILNARHFFEPQRYTRMADEDKARYQEAMKEYRPPPPIAETSTRRRMRKPDSSKRGKSAFHIFCYVARNPPMCVCGVLLDSLCIVGSHSSHPRWQIFTA